ncbi:NAD(P)H-binding protein [Croceicoccus marinus]|uniref:NAD(P)-binding domain-containing protein n=1 Tax=Croceicoccus marinus TaxID=450378 RepID=A0A1Z1FD25_9SPHN|nr:NAD(P)H-binding protein [Croceicoccus marinus]ARU16660.1 hypothetical protein A9D14_11335 [Croceicoccus marinus]
MSQKRIAVFGASGATGRETVRHALRAGLEVVAIDRALPDEADRINGVTYRQADVLQGGLAEAMEGCDAVISTLGVGFSPGNALSPPPLYMDGTRHILDGMEGAGIDRIAVISAAFVIDQPNLPTWFKLTVVPALHNILEQMKEMEALLEERPGLRWTAVRPGWLINKPASGDLLVEEEFLPKLAFRCRMGDLGAFLVDCVQNNLHIRKKPAVGAPEEEKFESPLALGEEFANL